MLATVNTIDKDIGANANVTYKFAATDGGDGETSKFTIDPFTGDITLGKNSFLVSQLLYNSLHYFSQNFLKVKYLKKLFF